MTAKLFEIRSLEGRGRGLFTTRDIKCGECILEEEPLMSCSKAGKIEVAILMLIMGVTWQLVMDGWEGYLILLIVFLFSCNAVWKLAENAAILRQASKLDEKQKQLLYRLQTANPGPISWLHSLMVFRSNALPNGGRGAVFATASIMNHSCAPNAFHHFDEKRNLEVVYAMRPIKRNDEITISYIDTMQVRADRQEQLKDTYGFECRCEACAMPEEKREVSDQRRGRIAALNQEIKAFSAMGKCDAVVENSEELVETIDKEFGDPSYKGDAYHVAFKALWHAKDKKKARVWASKGYKCLLATMGPANQQVKEAKMGSH
eukprot:TRINITY_DN34537_c0_g2_i2.p1 TRINITY_DN34537_c0_g2~~TRINITY_DN34537_c0_g2_i2.p1  ORF type:complete len:337 (+),score=57.12 TRINITY_DN34537_c0_g2_i2:59-1012(+)